MKRLLLITCFIVLSVTAIASGHSCMWSVPQFDAIDLSDMHIVQVYSSCSGGIVGCSARTKSYLWVYDPIADEWVIYGNNPRTNVDYFKNCGSSLLASDVAYDRDLPSGSYCCLEIEFWIKNGSSYSYVGSGFNYFWTP